MYSWSQPVRSSYCVTPSSTLAFSDRSIDSYTSFTWFRSPGRAAIDRHSTQYTAHCHRSAETFDVIATCKLRFQVAPHHSKHSKHMKGTTGQRHTNLRTLNQNYPIVEPNCEFLNNKMCGPNTQTCEPLCWNGLPEQRSNIALKTQRNSAN